MTGKVSSMEADHRNQTEQGLSWLLVEVVLFLVSGESPQAGTCAHTLE